MGESSDAAFAKAECNGASNGGSCDSDDELGFCSSKLGTKEYWEEAFGRDLKIYRETGDVGEVWFGNASVKRIVEWLETNPLVSHDHSVLDVGCGNGMTLINLAKKGFKLLTGVDYSSNAIELAREFAQDKGLNITYEVYNILEQEPLDGSYSLQHQFDVCIDKGTYDAISLNPDNSLIQRHKYKQSVGRLVKPRGLFIITSCNWTESELVEYFVQDFEVFDKIPTPEFKFGGSSGSKETVVVFRRRM